MADRQELIRNALAFLNDPNTRNHPLTQRIAFLESKGLTAAEIESVLAQPGGGPSNAIAGSSVSAGGPGASSSFGFAPIPSSSYGTPAQQQYAMAPPAVPERDWRDYFIMAVVSGGFLFGVTSFAKKYLVPHLKPPTVTAYETDQQALTAQFDEIAKLVASIDADTASQRTLLEEQSQKVDSALDKLQIAIKETKDAEAKTKADLRDIREEVNNVREMLPKMLEKNKDAQSQALLDLQQELKSLKTLLLSRPTPGTPSAYSTPITPVLGSGVGPYASALPPLPRPTSIPSWQLASPSSTAANTAPSLPTTPMSIPATVAPYPPSPAATITADKGKGKEALDASAVLVPEPGSGAESEDDSSSAIVA